ncbi:MAG: hypothetical protein PHG47_10650 [Sulfuricella sp.]|nr:hypothetical protein [Sulfuricella sp.]
MQSNLSPLVVSHAEKRDAPPFFLQRKYIESDPISLTISHAFHTSIDELQYVMYFVVRLSLHCRGKNMTTISVRLPDALLKAAEEGAKTLHVPRSEYFRLAIEAMNRRQVEESRRRTLMSASLRVRGESMAVNAEFDAVEHDAGA